MSVPFKQTLNHLGILHIFSTPYHPESQGALERFHGTLKSMLRKYTFEYGSDCEEGLPMLLLFAVRTSVQESLGYSPAELIFGHDVRGSLNMLKEYWMDSGPVGTEGQIKLSRLKSVWKIALSQDRMKVKYDKNSTERKLEVREQVLMYLPKPGESLQLSIKVSTQLW